MRDILAVFLCAFVASVSAMNFTIIDGQIFTPGLAIVDAPQPNTPLGGDFLQVALDVSGNGKLQLPPYPENAPTGFYNVTIFLTSYVTGLNLTITNGTAGSGNASLGDIMKQEPGRTVKHVNWVWPDCLVGNGKPKDSNSSRGPYNISIHQSFKLNSTNYYTTFDLPITVTNEISASPKRPSCDVLKNSLLSGAELNASTIIIPPSGYPWTNGQGTQTVIPDVTGSGTTEAPSLMKPSGTALPSAGSGRGTSSGGTAKSSSTPESTSNNTPDLGNPKPDASPGNGLGSEASVLGPGVSVGVLFSGLLALCVWGIA